MPEPGEGGDVGRLFELWLDSALKVQVMVFFHSNPGVIETVDGLARRLGTSAAAVEAAIADQVAMGLFRERRAGDKTVIVYDRLRQDELGRHIESRLASHGQGGTRG